MKLTFDSHQSAKLRSAIVPIATKSKNSAGGSSSKAVATLNATPTPANLEKDNFLLDDGDERWHRPLVNSQVTRDDL